MISRSRGKAQRRPYYKVASEVFTIKDLVTRNSSGYLTKATQTTPRSQLLGQICRSVVATDADYAQNTLVDVEVFEDNSTEFEATVDTGTLIQSMVGKQFDLADHNGIDVTSNAIGHVTILRVKSTTKAVVKFNIDGKTNMILKSYSQVIKSTDFTDGGSTAGTKALNVSIPVKSVYVQTLLSDLTGFSGDTSAVIIVGDGSDTDRYNTGTPSVFASADGADAGVPSGTKYHSGAKTPTVTITSASDFTAVVAGQVTVTMLWYEPIA